MFKKRILTGFCLLVLALETVYFGTQALAGLHRLLGEHAFLQNDHVKAWNHYTAALRKGGDRDRLETDLVELLLFGLDQFQVGVRIDLPLQPTRAAALAWDLVAGRIGEYPRLPHLWSLAADVYSQRAAQGRRETGIDLSLLSEEPLENIPAAEWLGLASLERAAALEPSSHINYDLLAETFLALGLSEQAARAAKKAVAARPVLEAHPYLTQAGVPEPVIEAALAGFEAAATRTSLVPQGTIQADAGRLLGTHGADARAIPYLERAIALAPDQYGARSQLATSLRRRGETARAIEQYEYLMKMAPDRWSPHYHAGQTYRVLGNLPKAIEALSRARDLDPQDVRTLHAFGEVLEDAGRRQEAGRQFAAAANLNKDDPAAWSGLLAFHVRNGETLAAREACTRLLGLRPEDPRYKSQCAVVEAGGP